ncbi:MAG: YbaB/EbfC family nucleoid-associated protein [Rhodospirillales bacterium]|jgi:DNA-binding YbaB/EbfC family protein
MANLGQMLKQAQEVQARMESLQNELAQLEVAGSSGGGMVRVTLTGKGEARGVKIDPTLCGPDDVEVLEDLLLAAFNDAKSRADAAMQEKISAVTGGLQMPAGLKLPF